MWLFECHNLWFHWARFSLKFFGGFKFEIWIRWLPPIKNLKKNSDEFTVGIYSASSLATHQNLRIPVNGINWQVSDSMGNVLPSDVFEVLESTERVRRDRLGIIGPFFLHQKHTGIARLWNCSFLPSKLLIMIPEKRKCDSRDLFFSQNKPNEHGDCKC